MSALGGVPGPGGCLLLGGVYSQGGGCTWSRGVSAPEGVCFGGVPGLGGVCSWGVSGTPPCEQNHRRL